MSPILKTLILLTLCLPQVAIALELFGVDLESSKRDEVRSAARGIGEQINRLDQNVDAIAKQSTNQFSDSSKQYALLEQHQIVNAVRANAKFLQVANQVIGTLLDIKV